MPLIFAVIFALSAQTFANQATKSGQVGDPNGFVQMLGAGSKPCETLLHSFRVQDTTSKIAFYSWFQGYSSAASAVLGTKVFATAQESLSFVDSQLVPYCQSKPREQVGHAADKLLQKKLGQIK